MSDPFIAEIRVFACNYAPRGWAMCDGRLMDIRQNQALFSLLGTTYGGDGQKTFALPNLAGRAVMQPGQGSYLSERSLGESGGTTTVALTQEQMPAHRHLLQMTAAVGSSTSPEQAAMAIGPKATPLYSPASAINGSMHPQTLLPTGQGQPHNNMQPYLVLNFCIALEGEYPSRL
jgi:microcystin-dependent protein